MCSLLVSAAGTEDGCNAGQVSSRDRGSGGDTGGVTEPADAVYAARVSLVVDLQARAEPVALAGAFDTLAGSLDRWCTNAPRELSMRGIDGAPDWYRHEMRTWRTCETVRMACMDSIGLRRLQPIVDSIEQFAALPSLGKGRQAWMAFALDVGKLESASRFAARVADEELQGMVLTGVVRYRVPGHAAAATMIAQPAGLELPAPKPASTCASVCDFQQLPGPRQIR